MEWSIGHSLIVVLALLLGLAAGWLLRGRQGVRASGQGPSIVDGDPVAGLAVVTTPPPAATTDEARPAATVDPAPAAVADEPAPVDTVSAPAAVTTDATSDGPTPADAPSTTDPADMALTDAPPASPAADADDLRPEPSAEPEPVAVEEQPAPATVIAPRQPGDDDVRPTDAPHADTTPAEAVDTEVTAVDTTSAEAPVTGAPADVDAEPVRATPPVRPTATATRPVRPVADTAPSGADTDQEGPADDFRRIQGVGPKMAAALQAAGVRTYGQLGELDEPALRDLIRAAGLRAAPGLASWPQQARVLAGAGDEMAAVLPGDARG
ncbi:helix-hairpin-helix domain-containing protein [Micromonospora sp. NPDC005161]